MQVTVLPTGSIMIATNHRVRVFDSITCIETDDKDHSFEGIDDEEPSGLASWKAFDTTTKILIFGSCDGQEHKTRMFPKSYEDVLSLIAAIKESHEIKAKNNNKEVK